MYIKLKLKKTMAEERNKGTQMRIRNNKKNNNKNLLDGNGKTKKLKEIMGKHKK